MRTSAWVLQFCFLHLSSSGMLDWTYHGEHSEDEWGTYFEHCLGKLQSPINIQRSKVRFNPDLEPLQLQGYGYRRDAFKMTNNGHSEKENSGSEHTIDGLRYMAEGSHFENAYYSDFIAKLAKIKYAGYSTTLDSLDIVAMLPENLSNFYRYHGSLTTPPCTENIDLLENTLLDWKNKTLRNDYRQIQPLNKRVIKASFSPRLFEGRCRPESISSKLNKIQTNLREMKKYLLDVIGKPGSLEFFQASTQKTTSKRGSPGFFHGSSQGETINKIGSFQLVGQLKDPANLTVSGGFSFPRSPPAELASLPLPLGEHASYVTIVPLKPMQLKTFTLCFWVQNSNQGRQTVLFYSTPESENELVISVGMAVGVWIGGKFVQFDLHRRAEDWVHHCVTWVSSSGTINLWVNGAVGTARNIQKNYIVQSGGTPILGKRKNAMLDVFADAFSGWMSHVNLWSWLLDQNDIQELTLCKHSQQKGDVLAWGETHMSLFGGVSLGPDTSC
ncbi:hypothetical protein E2320_006276, partial [Naja naja]